MIGFVKRLFRDDAAAEEVRFLELRVIALDAENGRLRATLERVAALTQEGR